MQYNPGCFPNERRAMPILVSASDDKEATPYMDALVAAGAKAAEIQVILPDDSSQDWKDASKAQGMLFSGGYPDLDPELYGEKIRYDSVKPKRDRDDREMDLLKEACRRQLPIFCICRGLQILNVACNGTLYQDLVQDGATQHQHRQTDEDRFNRQAETHSIEVIKPDSLLARTMSKLSCRVNSLHHQGIKKVGDGLRVVARSVTEEGENGIVEGLEPEQDYPFLLAVQWHPEELVHRPDQLGLFQHFVNECRHPTR